MLKQSDEIVRESLVLPHSAQAATKIYASLELHKQACSRGNTVATLVSTIESGVRHLTQIQQLCTEDCYFLNNSHISSTNRKFKLYENLLPGNCFSSALTDHLSNNSYTHDDESYDWPTLDCLTDLGVIDDHQPGKGADCNIIFELIDKVSLESKRRFKLKFLRHFAVGLLTWTQNYASKLSTGQKKFSKYLTKGVARKIVRLQKKFSWRNRL